MGHLIREVVEIMEAYKSQTLVGKSGSGHLPAWQCRVEEITWARRPDWCWQTVKTQQWPPSLSLWTANVTNIMCEMSRFSFYLSDMQIFLNQFWWGFIFSGHRNTCRNTPIRLMPLLISHVDPHGRGYCDRPTIIKLIIVKWQNPQTL